MGKAHACESFKKWEMEIEDEGYVYIVRLVTPANQRLGTDFGYLCSCPDPQAPGPCVHVLIAKGYHCGWHEMFDTEKQVEDDICPRCGGKVMEVAYTRP